MSPWLGHNAQICGQTLFWMLLQGCFRMRVAFKLVGFEYSTRPSGVWVGLAQSVAGLKTTKDCPPLNGNPAAAGLLT